MCRRLQLLDRWLDTWAGLGLVVAGLHRQGWDLQLTQYGDGNWRATFYVTGAAHAIVGGSAWEPTQWAATRRSVWGALRRNARPSPGHHGGRGIVSEPSPYLIDAQTLDHENEGGDRFALHLAGDFATMDLDCLLRTA